MSRENDEFEGYGIFNYSDGSHYEGEWTRSKRHGRGVYVSAEGNVYDGKWEMDQITGFGLMKYADGSVYNGYWINGTKNNFGSMLYPTKERYNGYWLNGERHYTGEYYFASGERYEGEWFMGEMRGFGSYFLANGTKIYQGQWLANKENGFGIAFAYDSMYYGEWKSGQRWGPGVIKYSSGETYMGEWRANAKNGKGFFYFADGDQYVGDFIEGNITANSLYWNATASTVQYNDIKFEDEAKTSVAAESPKACIDACLAETTCQAISFDKAESKCKFFASARGDFESAKNWVSIARVAKKDLNQFFLFNRLV